MVADLVVIVSLVKSYSRIWVEIELGLPPKIYAFLFVEFQAIDVASLAIGKVIDFTVVW